MFKLSKGAEYAVKGVLYLSMQPEGEIAYIDKISKDQDVPRAYLAKIFQNLCKKGYLKSYRGPDGGFVLKIPPGEITLLNIIETMEGPLQFSECLINTKYCRTCEECTVRDVWQDAQRKFLDHLASETFADLVASARQKSEVTKETHQLADLGG